MSLKVLTVIWRPYRQDFYTSKTQEYKFENRECSFAARYRYYTQSQLFVARRLTLRNLATTDWVQMQYTKEVRGERKFDYIIPLNTVLKWTFSEIYVVSITDCRFATMLLNLSRIIFSYKSLWFRPWLPCGPVSV
jgi:hypothetical protein